MTEKARLFQINLSNGGVPKLPLRSAEVTSSGILGDYQNDRKHHGGPDQNVSLYSLEIIQALQAEGHPIFAGATGENLTLSGLDWASLQPGTHISIGDTVEVALTDYATPCEKIRESFVDENFNRISHRKFPGWSRYYGRVLKDGRISVGDEVRILQP